MKRIVSFLLIFCMVFSLLSACQSKCKHNFSYPTCESPSVCQKCGEIKGKALGHLFVDATCTLPSVCENCGIPQGNPLGHSYQEATCTKPKTCSVCQTTSGTALGHLFKEATCTLPSVCENCGVSQGNPLGHSYQEATCTKPKICSVCQTTSGTALGHTSSDWISGATDYVNAVILKTKLCTACGIELDSTYSAINSLHRNNVFLPSPVEFCERIDQILQSVINKNWGTNLTAKITDGTSSTLAVAIMSDSTVVATMVFSGEIDVLTPSYREKQNSFSAFLVQDQSLSETFVYVILSIVLAVDPKLDVNSANELLNNVIGSGYSYNGVSYFVTPVSNKLIFGVSVFNDFN